MTTYNTIYRGQRALVTVLPPQYDPEPPVRPTFEYIHGPVTRHGVRQACYTVPIWSPQ